MKHDLQLPVSIWNLLPIWYYRNKGEVENIWCFVYLLGGNIKYGLSFVSLGGKVAYIGERITPVPFHTCRTSCTCSWGLTTIVV